MARYDTTEVKQQAFNGTASSYTFEGGIQTVSFYATADCFVDFDKDATTTTGFFIKSGVNLNPINFREGNIQKISVISSGGTGTLYILGIRG